jgi:hypothetical protein
MTPCPGQEGEFRKGHLDRSSQAPEFTEFVRPWLYRAREGEPFERLIYLWVAFNAWLSEIIDPPEMAESDAALVSTAARDAQLADRFNDLLANDATFSDRVKHFQGLFPVSNVRSLDRHHIGPWEDWRMSRPEYRAVCFRQKLSVRDYKPRCYLDHQSRAAGPAGDPMLVPLDWPHVLAPMYQVRCNLFHGGKSFRLPTDISIVSLAYQVLWKVWGEPLCD